MSGRLPPALDGAQLVPCPAGEKASDLDPLIEATIKVQETGEGEAANCEPTYPRPLGSVAEARERLAQVLDGHVPSTATYAAARAAYRADLRSWLALGKGGRR
jgi:hypothetical protein